MATQIDISSDTQDQFEVGIDEVVTQSTASKVGTDEVGTHSTASKVGIDELGTQSTASKVGTDEVGTNNTACKVGTDEVGTQKPKRLKRNFPACSACKFEVAMWKWSRNGNVFCSTCMLESMKEWNEDDGPMEEFLDITGLAIINACASKAT